MEGLRMKKVVFYIGMTALLFSTMEVALKIGGASLDSLQLTFLRFFIGGLVLAPFAIREYREKFAAKGERIGLKDIGWLGLVGIMCIPVSMLCFQLGIDRCNAATASAIICMNPIFTMLLAHLFTTEKMDRAKWITLGLGIAAGVFLMRPWDVQAGNTTAGLVIMFISAITFGAYTVMGKKTLVRVGIYTQTSLSFIIGSLVLLVIIFTMGRPVLDGVAENWLTVVYCGVIVTGLGYWCYFMAIKLSDASTGALAFYIKPMIAPIFAIAILHETIMWNTVVGIVLMVAGSAITIIDMAKEKVNE